MNDLIKNFSNLDFTKYPDFYTLEKPSEKALWILFVAKEELDIKRLTAKQIADIIRDCMEISIDAKSIYNSFNPKIKNGLIHKYQINGENYYEIMKPGKDYVLNLVKNEILNIQYFKSGQRFTSKRILSESILDVCQGELKIVDPYIGIRTLDILRKHTQEVKFLTRLSNLRTNEANNVIREIKDFCSEFTNFQFKDYPNIDLHDRYIISDNYLIISGYSFKDLGKKESFALFIERSGNIDIIKLIENGFSVKWSISNPI